MIPPQALASRIRQDLADLQPVIERVGRAAPARRQRMAEPEILLVGAALNLHDVSTGLERIVTQIASAMDQFSSAGPDWHRELLRRWRAFHNFGLWRQAPDAQGCDTLRLADLRQN